MGNKFLDINLIREVPNKYNLTVQGIKGLVIKDWEKLKTLTWYNEAKKDTGTWWCHLEGCQLSGNPYDDTDEFWIGFREEDNKIDCHFSCDEGMRHYNFKEFYKIDSIEHKYDMNVQVNVIRWLNKLIDDGVLALK